MQLMKLRRYQTRIVDEIGCQNAIVKMPTGSGKTVVAAAVIQRTLEMDVKRRILFLVPTRELVTQQAAVVVRWCPAAADSVGLYHGGLKEVTSFRVLVSTPQAFRSLQVHQQMQYSWSRFSLVVYDEVHHVLKDHPYRQIAMGLLAWYRNHEDQRVQTLGLSASLTYEVQANKIKNSLDRLCRELSIECMVSPSIDELEADGYVPQHGRNVEVLSTHHSPEGVTLEDYRKPHLVHKTFMTRIREGNSTEFASDIMAVIKLLENVASIRFAAFKSPLANPKLSSWEDYAYKLSAKCARSNEAFFGLLECWYVALRVLVQTWEEEAQIVLQWLKMKTAVDMLPSVLQQDAAVVSVRSRMENEHNLDKLGCLRNQIITKKALHGPSFKCIVFVEQRFTAMVVSHFLNEFDFTLQAAYVASSGSSITPSIKVTKSVVAASVAAFRDGRSSVLVATSVIEEGFDIPEANVVLLYDHLKDSVQLCQRFGRARATNCSIVVMAERHDRPLSFLEEVRQEQDQLVHDYDAASRRDIDPAIEDQRQRSRERSAFQHVLADRSKCRDLPVQSLNAYVKKTKALLDQKIECTSHGEFVCKLTYSSHLRSLEVSSVAVSKKIAKAECAAQLLVHLEERTRE